MSRVLISVISLALIVCHFHCRDRGDRWGKAGEKFSLFLSATSALSAV